MRVKPIIGKMMENQVLIHRIGLKVKTTYFVEIRLQLFYSPHVVLIIDREAYGLAGGARSSVLEGSRIRIEIIHQELFSIAKQQPVSKKSKRLSKIVFEDQESICIKL